MPFIATRVPVEIHVWQAESEDEARRCGSTRSCYVRVQNIQALYEEFKVSGAPFAFELTLQSCGMNEMQVNDPHGNAIRFGEIVGV